jgi:hypothetical protein
MGLFHVLRELERVGERARTALVDPGHGDVAGADPLLQRRRTRFAAWSRGSDRLGRLLLRDARSGRRSRQGPGGSNRFHLGAKHVTLAVGAHDPNAVPVAGGLNDLQHRAGLQPLVGDLDRGRGRLQHRPVALDLHTLGRGRRPEQHQQRGQQEKDSRGHRISPQFTPTAVHAWLIARSTALADP